MKVCAEKAGVIGIDWMPFLVPNSRPACADLVRHMDHVKNLCGEDHVSIGTDGKLSKTVIDDKVRAAQKKCYDERVLQGIAAPGEGPEIFNIVVERRNTMRYRHLAGGLSKAGWTVGQIERRSAVT